MYLYTIYMYTHIYIYAYIYMYMYICILYMRTKFRVHYIHGLKYVWVNYTDLTVMSLD